MTIKIRQGIFETNSSSTHSLVVNLDVNVDNLIKEAKKNHDKIFLFSKDFYNKLQDMDITSGIRISDYDLKLVFLLAFCNNNNLIDLISIILEVLKKHRFKIYLNTKATEEEKVDGKLSIKQNLENIDDIKDAIIKIKDILDSEIWIDTGIITTPLINDKKEKELFLKMFFNEDNLIKYLFSDNSYFINIYDNNITYDVFPDAGMNIIYRSSPS